MMMNTNSPLVFINVSVHPPNFASEGCKGERKIDRFVTFELFRCQLVCRRWLCRTAIPTTIFSMTIIIKCCSWSFPTYVILFRLKTTKLKHEQTREHGAKRKQGIIVHVHHDCPEQTFREPFQIHFSYSSTLYQSTV